MSAQRRRDTAPEVALRRRLFASGERFRVAYRVPELPRCTIDVAFTRGKVAVFVDGCFWHSCPDHATRPRSNASWWETKLARNIERDRKVDAHLHGLGWTVLRFWEHEDPSAACARVLECLAKARKA
jgi:DNA mismatch endonuclease (patch repair protein)